MTAHSIRSIFMLGRKSSLGLVDQSLVSATSLVTLVVVARELEPRAFGLYVLATTAVMIMSGLQTALVTQPHNVLAAAKGPDDYVGYSASTAAFQVLFSITMLLFAALAATTLLAMGSAAGTLVLAGAAAALGLQLLDFARRVLYTEGRIAAALALDCGGYGGSLVLLGALAYTDTLSANTALLSLSLSTVGAGAAGIFILRSSLGGRIDLKAIRENWEFGKWLAAARTGFWLSSHLYLYLGAALLGTAAAGVVKAAQILLAPLNVVLLFLEIYLPIEFARSFERGGTRILRRRLLTAYLLTALPIGLYCGFMALFGGRVLQAVYGEKYVSYRLLVTLFAIYYLLSYVAQLLVASLNARRMSRPVFLGNLGGAAFAVSIGWFLVRGLGEEGVVIGMCGSALILGVVALAFELQAGDESIAGRS